jgi:hypothetical protein
MLGKKETKQNVKNKDTEEKFCSIDMVYNNLYKNK